MEKNQTQTRKGPRHEEKGTQVENDIISKDQTLDSRVSFEPLEYVCAMKRFRIIP